MSIRGAIEPGSAIQGSVMQVQAVNLPNGDGRTVEVTNVTFLEDGTSIDMVFAAIKQHCSQSVKP